MKAVFVPHALRSTLVVFLDDKIEQIEDVEDWSTGIEAAQKSAEAMLSAGWYQAE